MILAGEALEDQPGHARDLAELAAAEFRGIEAGHDVALHVVGCQQTAQFAQAEVRSAGGDCNAKP